MCWWGEILFYENLVGWGFILLYFKCLDIWGYMGNFVLRRVIDMYWKLDKV